MNDLFVGAYRLDELLPGSHSTFLARSHQNSERVAIKVVMGVFGEREWQAIAGSLSHAFPPLDGLCPVTEIGVRKELIYAVAPFIDGINLQQAIKAVGQDRSLLDDEEHVRGATLIVARLAHTAIDLLKSRPDCLRGYALAAEEFVLGRDGRVLMLDPRWVTLRTVLNQPRSRSLVHSLAYQMPDRDRFPDNHEAAFVWGLCTILWELCTGYRLFRRLSLVETLQSLSERHVPEPSSLNFRVPYQVDALISRVLRSPQTVKLEALANDLVRMAAVDPAQHERILADWVDRIEPFHSVHDGDDDSALNDLEALLDDEEGVTWKFSEDSTTFVEGPPSTRLTSDELYWLEDAPDIPVTVATEGVSVAPDSDDDDDPGALRLFALFALVVVATTASTLLLYMVGSNPGERAAERAAERVDGRATPLVEVASSTSGNERVRERTNSERVFTLDDVSPPELENELLPPPSPAHPSVTVRTPTKPPTVAEGSGSGDLAIFAPPAVSVYWDDLLLGHGNVRTTLVEGAYRLRLVPRQGKPSYVQANVRAGAMSVVTIRD